MDERVTPAFIVNLQVPKLPCKRCNGSMLQDQPRGYTGLRRGDTGNTPSARAGRSRGGAVEAVKV